MPSEIRNIVFTQNEVVRALIEYRKHKKRPLPPGSVFKFAIDPRPNVRLALAIAVDGQDRLDHMEFQSEELGAALVMHCMQSRIPLPARGAQKALQVYGESLSLVVTIGAATHQLNAHVNTN